MENAQRHFNYETWKDKEWQMSVFKHTTNFTKCAACDLQCAATTSVCKPNDITDIKMQYVTGRQYFNCFSLNIRHAEGIFQIMIVDFRLCCVLGFDSV
jgi:hypothetical protein